MCICIYIYIYIHMLPRPSPPGPADSDRRTDERQADEYWSACIVTCDSLCEIGIPTENNTIIFDYWQIRIPQSPLQVRSVLTNSNRKTSKRGARIPESWLHLDPKNILHRLIATLAGQNKNQSDRVARTTTIYIYIYIYTHIYMYCAYIRCI